ncbi:hypothetical protein [Methylophilus sp. YYY-1]|uniref:WapI family immunity protein n=1 Tax=Methylophilus sp. YYY-1 TaxID=2682087 RepID=UPI0023B27B63|nr:hypothetical protein [Methylophilus sp. YYY-1]MDF0376906.1 hypothetical protein [Methylophilus sp. YYY-1]
MKITGHAFECEIDLSLPDSEEWMDTNVKVKTQQFQGAFTCTVQKSEWLLLIKTLKKLDVSVGKSTELKWSNMEENIYFEFKLSALGSLKTEYKFSSENFSDGPVLSGYFTADQSYIGVWENSARQEVENAL